MQDQTSEDNESNARSLSNENNQHDITGPSGAVIGAAPISTARAPEQSAAILKLDIDCFEETFDFLPVKDLVNVGNTCKRLNKVIGHILHEYYPGAISMFKNDGIFMPGDLKINHLAEYIQKIHFSGRYYIDFFEHIQSKCYRLRRIYLDRINLIEPQIDCLKIALHKVEILQLQEIVIYGDFYEKLLKFCPNVKTLSIFWHDCFAPVFIGNGNEWMHRRYPTLEHFVFDNFVNTEVTTFLELNQNIRKFSADDEYIRGHEHSLMTANIRLDELEIYTISIDTKLVNQLNALYERGFYQRLRMFISFPMNYDDMHQFAQLNGLITFCIADHWSNGDIFLSNLTGLKDFGILTGVMVDDLPLLPLTLPDLERIQFEEASTDDILPFIRQSVNLEKIKIDNLMPGTYFNTGDNVINLVKMNEDRARLQKAQKTSIFAKSAQKITIYVKEEVYLATKWALKETDFTYVRLKRLEANEWNHSFTFPH